MIDEIKRQTREHGPRAAGQGADERAVRVQHRSRQPRRKASRSGRRLTSTFWKSTRGPAARCRSCPRRPACRWPGWRRWSWSARRSTSWACIDEVVPTHFSVKESVFPFNKFPGVDIILGPEMRSTGEVMGIDDTFPDGVRQEPAGRQLRALPLSGTVFISRGRPRQGGG